MKCASCGDSRSGSDGEVRRISKTDLSRGLLSKLTQYDNALPGTGNGIFDAKYTIDNLNRVTGVEEGNWDGSDIDVTTRHETWGLTQTGNWNAQSWDANGDGDTTDVGDMTLGTQAYNEANEWTSRQVSVGTGSAYATTTYTPAYDGNGGMTNDGKTYKYEYDAFGRMRKVRNRTNDALVSEYKYNALGYRIRWTYDTDADGDVDASDQTYNLTYNERWQQVAVFRGTDANPKERYVHHAGGGAGLDGQGGSLTLKGRECVGLRICARRLRDS
jgi:hypothetical protein